MHRSLGPEFGHSAHDASERRSCRRGTGSAEVTRTDGRTHPGPIPATTRRRPANPIDVPTRFTSSVTLPPTVSATPSDAAALTCKYASCSPFRCSFALGGADARVHGHRRQQLCRRQYPRQPPLRADRPRALHRLPAHAQRPVRRQRSHPRLVMSSDRTGGLHEGAGLAPVDDRADRHVRGLATAKSSGSGDRARTGPGPRPAPCR